MARARPGALSREAVLRAALRIVDERGPRALTMRALGAELGVEAMSLYRHVPGKRAVEDGVVELLVDELAAGLAGAPAAGGDWRAALERPARAFRGLAKEHPNAFGLFAERPARAWVAARATSEATLAALRAAGFDGPTAVAALRTVIRYVIGYSLAQLAATTGGDDPGRPSDLAREGFPLVADVVAAVAGGRDEELFEFGLAVLLDGLDARRRGSGTGAVDRARAPG